jgi:hypothetical protein
MTPHQHTKGTTMKKLATLIAALVAALAFTTVPAHADIFGDPPPPPPPGPQAQTVYHNLEWQAFVGQQSRPVVAYGSGSRVPASLTSLTPGKCTVKPGPSVKYLATGVCMIRMSVPASPGWQAATLDAPVYVYPRGILD